MTCESFEARIALYTSGDLDAAEAARVDTHLATCARCRAFAAELAENQEALQSLADVDIATAALAVRRRVLEAIDTVPRRSAWPNAPWAALAASILIAAALLLPRSHTPTRVVIATEPPRRVDATPAPAPPVPPIARTASRPAVSSAVRHRRPPAPPPRLTLEPPLARAPDGAAAGDADAPTSASRVVKVASSDPNVVIYWVLDEPAPVPTGEPDGAGAPPSQSDFNGGPS